MKKFILAFVLFVMLTPAAMGSVSPIEVTSTGGAIVFSGCGYKTNVNDYIYVYAAPSNQLGSPVLNEWVLVDSKGCFSSDSNVVSGYPIGSFVAGPGIYTVTVHQNATNRNAALNFTVN